MLSTQRRIQRIRGIRRDSSGQAQVEFVLSILVVLFLIFGIIELIMLIHTYNVLADAAKEGVRYAIVHGCDFGSGSCSGTCSLPPPSPSATCDDATADNVKNWALNFAKASLRNVPASAVTVTYPDGSADAPNRVQVSISYNYDPFLGLGWPNITVHANAEGRIVY
jgi:hypothetical protein